MARQKGSINTKELAEQLQVMGANVAMLTERVAALEFGVKKLGGEEPPRAAMTCGKCGRSVFWYMDLAERPRSCPQCGNAPVEKKAPEPEPEPEEEAEDGD